MRLVLSRVRQARVDVGEECTGAIGPGLLVLAGVQRGDGSAQVRSAARRILDSRLLGPPGQERSVVDARAEVLLVSQFTLLGRLGRGRRPEFLKAAPAGEAEPLFEALVAAVRAGGVPVATGRFGADMQVHAWGDGPYTLIWDSHE